jgi:Plavaka transposase
MVMDTIDVQFMDLDPTLRTTQSKFCWHASCRVGALGEQGLCFSYLYISYMLFYRCDAKWDNLDGNIAGRRSHELTCSLVAALDRNSLWDDYGIVSDIMVCHGWLSNSCLPSLGFFQPFTHGFPRADIHELLSPDLLHQIIKGTFKDHLVTWVTNYIKLKHPPVEAKRILADIDRR